MRSSTVKLTYFLLLCLCFSTIATAKNILGIHLDYRFKPNGTDQYNLLLEEMTQDGFSFEIDYLPLKRVWRGMAEDSLACTFPSSSSAVALGTNMDISNFIQSKTIDHVSYRVVVRPGEAIVTDPTKLIGKRVAVWNGMPNAKLLGQENIELEETNSEETRVKMLFNDRVDAMIGFVPDLHIVAEQLGYPQPESAGSLVVWGGRNGTHLVCHDTPENRALIEQFDNVLTKVKTSGRLREILGPYADINE